MASSDPPKEEACPLHAAARSGHVPTIESLLSTNPKLASSRDADDRLAIHWACAYNHLPIIQQLSSLRSFDPDAQDGSGWTPLMIASSLPSDAGLDAVQLLLRKDAEVKTQSTSGGTALHFASSKSNLEVCKALLSEGASARTKDKRGQLPLHRAAAVGSIPIVKILLDAKSPINGSDMDGMTALHHAISEGHGHVAVELLKRGAEADKKDADGRVALDCAPDGKVRSFILKEAEREGIELPE